MIPREQVLEWARFAANEAMNQDARRFETTFNEHFALIVWNAALERAAAECERQPYKYKATRGCAAAILSLKEPTDGYV